MTKVKGPKKLVKRAVFAARCLGVEGFKLKLEWSNESSECIANDDGSFVIRVFKNQPKFTLMESVGHEMTHLRQFHYGQLTENSIQWTWENKTYPWVEYMSDGYFLAPWEMEARAMEAWLVYRWETRK